MKQLIINAKFLLGVYAFAQQLKLSPGVIAEEPVKLCD
jgi:hypothetical protein